MYLVGVSLVKDLDKTSGGGGGGVALTITFLMSIYLRSFLCPFFTIIKLCYTKALE